MSTVCGKHWHTVDTDTLNLIMCIISELAGGGSVAVSVDVGVSDR